MPKLIENLLSRLSQKRSKKAIVLCGLHRIPLPWLQNHNNNPTLCWEILQRVPAWKKALDKGDWPVIEADIRRLARLMASEVTAACLNWHLDRDETRQQGRQGFDLDLGQIVG